MDNDFLLSLFSRLKHPFIWLSRFRHRCGYGVHSPFAFSLITDVIYEKTPYYAYQALEAERKRRVIEQGWKKEEKRIWQLLFRLVNRVQPHTIVEVGTPSVSSIYLEAACPSSDYLFASDLSELFLEAGATVDFLYLNNEKNPDLQERAFCICADRATPDSLFVIKGIGYSRAMKKLWLRLQQDERVGITFDLYDVGLLFFDKTKIKQHYIVNF